MRYMEKSKRFSLGAGSQNGEPVYITESVYFRRESLAHNLINLRHTGWYTDSEFQSEMMRGIVASLPHGKFLAGFDEPSGTRVWYPEIFTDEHDAARMADEHARVAAERECEYQDRAREALDAQEKEHESVRRLRECVALRNRHCMEYVRDEARELIGGIRMLRDDLAGKYADYL